MDSNSTGVYVIANLGIEDIEKVVYGIQFNVTNQQSEGNTTTQTDVEMVEIAKLDALSLSKVVAFYLMPEEQYGVLINMDGVIAYFEYDESKPEWEQRAGTSESGNDEMYYARTRRFYDNP